MDIKKPQLVKVEAFVLVFWVGSAAPSTLAKPHVATHGDHHTRDTNAPRRGAPLRWLKNLVRFYCARSFPVGCVTQPTAIQGSNPSGLQSRGNLAYFQENCNRAQFFLQTIAII